jgi:hypothetical protein
MLARRRVVRPPFARRVRGQPQQPFRLAFGSRG